MYSYGGEDVESHLLCLCELPLKRKGIGGGTNFSCNLRQVYINDCSIAMFHLFIYYI